MNTATMMHENPYVRARAVTRIAISLVLFATIGILLARPLLSINAVVPKHYNEGWNALITDVALRGGQIYPASTSLIANNYPPLAFHVVGAVGALTGDHIIAGQWISLVSFCVVAVGVDLAARSLTGATRAGVLSSTTLVAYLSALHPKHIGMDDPQWLSQALMICPLVLLFHRTPTVGVLTAMSALAIAAGMAKHNRGFIPRADRMGRDLQPTGFPSLGSHLCR